MSTHIQTVRDLIDRSISHSEIVTVDFEHELSEELTVQAEDSVDDVGSDRREFWGTRDGSEWRVHLRGLPRRIRAGA